MDDGESTAEEATTHTTDSDETDGERRSTPVGGGAPLSLQLTDFSNHLGIVIEPDADDDGGSGSVTLVDPDALVHVASEEDTYGWEAELDRKISTGLFPRPDGEVCCYDQFEYRRANGNKRNLLHRVFSSISHSAKDARLEARRH